MKIQLRWAAVWLALFAIPVTFANGDGDVYFDTEMAGSLEPMLASFGDVDDSNCKGGCSKGGCGCKSGLLGGLIAPSDTCFSDFISPMTNPAFFEDPRTLTEARIIYLHHKVPLTALGGDVNVVAVQLRAALTDRLSIIATKDGFVTSTNP